MHTPRPACKPAPAGPPIAPINPWCHQDGLAHLAGQHTTAGWRPCYLEALVLGTTISHEYGGSSLLPYLLLKLQQSIAQGSERLEEVTAWALRPLLMGRELCVFCCSTSAKRNSAPDVQA